MIITCDFCKTEFTPKRSTAKYCSDVCRAAFNRNKDKSLANASERSLISESSTNQQPSIEPSDVNAKLDTILGALQSPPHPAAPDDAQLDALRQIVENTGMVASSNEDIMEILSRVEKQNQGIKQRLDNLENQPRAALTPIAQTAPSPVTSNTGAPAFDAPMDDDIEGLLDGLEIEQPTTTASSSQNLINSLLRCQNMPPPADYVPEPVKGIRQNKSLDEMVIDLNED